MYQKSTGLILSEDKDQAKQGHENVARMPYDVLLVIWKAECDNLFWLNQGSIMAMKAYLLGLILELLDGTLVDSTALVDQMASGGRLSGVDVANDHDVDMSLLLAHGGM